MYVYVYVQEQVLRAPGFCGGALRPLLHLAEQLHRLRQPPHLHALPAGPPAHRAAGRGSARQVT